MAQIDAIQGARACGLRVSQALSPLAKRGTPPRAASPPPPSPPDRLSSLPNDLVSLVFDAVSERDMRSLAVVSSNLSQAAHPHVQGAALDAFLNALIDVTEAYFEHEDDADFDWAGQCEWIAEWDDVPVNGVVAPKD